MQATVNVFKSSAFKLTGMGTYAEIKGGAHGGACATGERGAAGDEGGWSSK
jgi:hypothetical protein